MINWIKSRGNRRFLIAIFGISLIPAAVVGITMKSLLFAIIIFIAIPALTFIFGGMIVLREILYNWISKRK